MTMLTVSGCNLFNQWLSKKALLEFEKIKINPESPSKFDKYLDGNTVELKHIKWYYNLFQNKKDLTFYLIGYTGDRENILEINIPQEIISDDYNSLMLNGNDYHLFLIHKSKCFIWIYCLKNKKYLKKFDIYIESNLYQSNNSIILKFCVMGNLYLCLMSDGKLYQGLPPSLVNKSEVIGDVCDIDCGYEHCILLTLDGKVYTWGNGRRLQLGHGDLSNVEQPKLVEALAGIKITKVKAGGWHCMALSEFKDLYVWGWNDMGQLGIKTCKENSETNLETKTSYALPTLVEFYDENGIKLELNVKDISCGSRHSVVLIEDNSLWATGFNKYSQLGCCPSDLPVVNLFKKVYQSEECWKIMCGPWSTVLIKQ